MRTKSAARLAWAGLCVILLNPAQAAPQRHLAPPANAAGQLVRTAEGAPRNYARAELEPAKIAPSTVESSPVGLVQAAQAGGSAVADWGFTALGSGIGLSGIVSAKNGQDTEVYAGGSTQTFGADTYWYALRWNKKKVRFEQTFASELFSAPIVRIVLAKAASATPQIVVGLADGVIVRYDQQTRSIVGRAAGPCASHGGLAALEAADLDGNGVDELVAVCADTALVADGAGYADWTLAGVGGNQIVIAQMDDDPALEIATTSGWVVDAASHKAQWIRAKGFGSHLQAGDVDGDGRAELIAADPWYVVRAYDVEMKAQKWSVPTNLDIGNIRLADVDGDGVAELLIGDGQWGQVRAVDTTTRMTKGAIANPEHGVTQIAVVDLDGDGKPELLWGAGYTSTGPDHLYVANWAAKSIVWQNVDLTGPFVGPVVGDLDGDGLPEIVFASRSSDAGYSSGRIIVIDGNSLKLRAISQGVAGGQYSWSGLRDIQLRDLDGDGRLEVLVGADWLYDGLIEAYSFSPDGVFTLRWTNASRPPNGSFDRVDAADVDGDGVPEILGGLGNVVYAYDATTGAKKWQTGALSGSVVGLIVGDFDGDGATEFAAAAAGGDVYVFSGASHKVEVKAGVSMASSLALLEATTPPRFVVGRFDGKATVRAFDGVAAYPEVMALAFTTDGIDGVMAAQDGGWWAGSLGRLLRSDGTTTLLSTATYGGRLGRQIAQKPGDVSRVFSCGAIGCYRFKADR